MVLVLLIVVLPAHADSDSSTPTPVSVSTRLVKDPAQITEIANTLRKSDALMATFENAPSEEVTTQWLETFASVMTRDQAQRLQQTLSAQGYDTKGTDGVLGANTRRAFAAWQAANGQTPDGFISQRSAAALIGGY